MAILRKKVYKAAVVWFAVIAAVIMTVTGAFAFAEEQTADSDIRAAVVKHNTAPTEYFYFDYPTAIFAYGRGFTVADRNTEKAYSFDASGKQTELIADFVGSDFSGVEKFDSAGGIPVLMSGGTITVDGKQIEQSAYTDFTLSGTKLYAIRAGAAQIIDEYTVTDFVKSEPETTGPENEEGEENESGGEETEEPAVTAITPIEHRIDAAPQKIASDGNHIYVSVANRHLNNVIYFTPDESGEWVQTECLTASEEIKQMCGKSDGGVICLTRTEIIVYNTENGSLVPRYRHDAYDTVAIASFGGTVYGISNLNAVYKINETFTDRITVLASAHNAKDFFYSSAGISSRKDFIAVADERNNRVQIIRGGSTTEIPVTRPKAVAIDYTGNIYVGYDGCKIDIFNSNTLAKVRSVADDPLPTVITDLKIDSDNNLYVLCSNKQVYKIVSGDSAFMPVGNANVAAIGVAQSDDSLITATVDNNVYRLSGGTAAQTPEFSTDSPVADVCTDHADSYYVLTTDGAVIKYDRRGNKVTAADNYGLIGATKIAMSTVDTDLGDVRVKYGDLLVSDTQAHAVKVIDGNKDSTAQNALKVNSGFDMSNETPKEDSLPGYDSLNEQSEDGVIFTVSACYVYTDKAERNNTVAFLPDGYKVIVPSFDKYAKFTRIIADSNAQTSVKPVIGYIYTSMLKDPDGEPKRIPYSDAPNPSCKTHKNSAVPIYKYPSRDLTEIAKLDENTELTLLPFVYTDKAYGYTDNTDHAEKWYRVLYNGKEGYILSNYIVFLDEEPDNRNVYPQLNATVVASDGAMLYKPDENGEITMLYLLEPGFALIKIEKGKRVEVVGGFDSSKKFTHIKYYCDEIGGTMDFYVETKTLKYDGVNKVLVIAIVIIIITVILGIILIARMAYVKRTRRLADTKM